MPGWDAFSVPQWFARRYDAPVLVDNDVNLMALGEHRHHERGSEAMLFVKVGTGIGCGIIAAGGKIYRGAQGAAGDIGHIRVPGHDDVRVPLRQRRLPRGGGERRRAGAGAVTRPDGRTRSSRDVLELVRAGDDAASQAVRTAGEQIGGCARRLRQLLQPRAGRDRRRPRGDQAASRRRTGGGVAAIAAIGGSGSAHRREPSRRPSRRARSRDHGDRARPRARGRQRVAGATGWAMGPREVRRGRTQNRVTTLSGSVRQL